MSPIRMVVATRAGSREFGESTPLGRSLRHLAPRDRLEVAAAFSNRVGLPAIYNGQISEEHRDKVLVFVHDDVELSDFFFAERIREVASPRSTS